MSPLSPEYRELRRELAKGGFGAGPGTVPTSRVVFEDGYLYQ